MIYKVRPKRICPVCLGMYKPNRNDQKYCNECRENRKYEIRLYQSGNLRPIGHDAMDALHAMNADIEAYNKKHGTCLTYGKYVHMKTYGLLVEE